MIEGLDDSGRLTCQIEDDFIIAVSTEGVVVRLLDQFMHAKSDQEKTFHDLGHRTNQRPNPAD